MCLTPEIDNAKTCCICGAQFTPKRSTKKYCRDACRMTAALKRESTQRINRRAYRDELVTRANRARAITFDGRYGGPIPDGYHVPRIGHLKLSDFTWVRHV